MGVKNKGGLDVFSQLIEKKTANRGLSGADFAGEDNDSFSLGDTIRKMGEGFLMFFAEKKESRVAGYVKRTLF
jgi:hypothetical protein